MVLAQNIKQKYRPMEQDKKPRDKPMHLWTLHFDKGGKNIQWRSDNLFNKWCQKNWTATCERMKLGNFLIPNTKVNSKWIKNLNVRLEAIELSEVDQKRFCCTLCQRVFCLCFPLTFVVSSLTFRSLILFEFTFVYGTEVCFNFILLHVAIQFSQHHLLKRLSFLHCIYMLPLSQIR